MKHKPLLALGLLFGASLFAAAQDGAPQRPNRPQRGQGPPPELVKQFDKDGDGKLSPEEAKAAREARQAEMLKQFDKDGDGQLSEEERAAMPKPPRGPGGPGGKEGKGGKGGKGGRPGPGGPGGPPQGGPGAPPPPPGE